MAKSHKKSCKKGGFFTNLRKSFSAAKSNYKSNQLVTNQNRALANACKLFNGVVPACPMEEGPVGGRRRSRSRKHRKSRKSKKSKRSRKH